MIDPDEPVNYDGVWTMVCDTLNVQSMACNPTPDNLFSINLKNTLNQRFNLVSEK